MEDNRIDYKIKILYFLGIVFIVAGHLSGGGINLMYDWFPLYSFHLALFAFCSGYLYKRQSSLNVKGYIIKKIRKLIIPLYIFNVFYALFVEMLSYLGFTIGAGGNLFEKLTIIPITTGHQFYYNFGGWFVIPLFIILVFNVLMQKLYSKLNWNNIFLYIVYVLLGILGVYIASIGYNTGWYLVLVRSLYLLQFFAMGLIYNEYLEKYDKLNSLLYFGVLFAITMAIMFIYGKIPSYMPSWCNTFNDGPIMPLVVGVLGISFWLRVSKILEPAIGKSKVVNTIADNTYYIMIHHFLGFMFVKLIFYILYLVTPKFQNFNLESFKTDIFYAYVPKGIPQFKIIYLCAGIAIPLLIRKLVNKTKYFKKVL